MDSASYIATLFPFCYPEFMKGDITPVTMISENGRARIVKAKIRIEKDRARIEKDRARILKAKIRIEKDRARIEKDRARILKARARIEKDRARIEKDRTRIDNTTFKAKFIALVMQLTAFLKRNFPYTYFFNADF